MGKELDMHIYKYVSIALVCALVLVGSALRFVGLSTHRTHIDDLGVALTILDAREPGYFQRRLADRSSPTFETTPKRLLRSLLPAEDDPGIMRAALDHIAPAIAVPLSWTYAPLQFVLTALLLPDAGTASYEQNLFWGRFPSALFGGLSLLVLCVLLKRMYGPSWPNGALLALAFFATSWEHIIFSQQMCSYAIGTLSILLGLWLCVAASADLKKHKSGASRFGGYGVALALLVYAQYQMLFFGAAALLALATPWLWQAWDERSLRALPVRPFAALTIVFGLLSLPAAVYITVKGFSAVNWNAGPDGEFAFNFAALRTDPLYPLRFFVSNSLIVSGTLLAFLPEGHPAARVLDPLLTLACWFGLVHMLRTKEPARRVVGQVLTALVVVWALLILARRLTLGPTRHSLILLPPLLLCLAETWHSMLEALQRRIAWRHLHWLGLATTALAAGAILLGFGSQRTEVAARRRDPYSSERVRAGALSRGVTTIVHDGYHMPLMSELSVRSVPWLQLDAARQAELLNAQQPVALLGIKGETYDQLAGALQRAGYREVYRDETFDPIELEQSQRTRNGSNDYELYVFEPQRLAAH